MSEKYTVVRSADPKWLRWEVHKDGLPYRLFSGEAYAKAYAAAKEEHDALFERWVSCSNPENLAAYLFGATSFNATDPIAVEFRALVSQWFVDHAREDGE